MAYRPHGRATTNSTHPETAGMCDRCYLMWDLRKLRFQYDWRGPSLQNLGIRVCPICYDQPSDQLRPIVLPPDPDPVFQPRPPSYEQNNYGGISPEMAAQPPQYITGLD
jgi:hypothetical protein